MAPSSKPRDPVLLALSGPSGAGKSTFATLLARQLRRRKYRVVILRIAEPLYAVQRTIYRLAGRPTKSAKFQDTRLLSFLGGHFRKIKKDSLLEAFALKVKEQKRRLCSSGTQLSAIICSDARRPDLERLQQMGFVMIHIDAPHRAIVERIEKRDDASPFQVDPKLEIVNSRWSWDYLIDNSGSLDALNKHARELAAKLDTPSDDPDRKRY
jgi:dephospho-CoA kinase